MVQIVIHYFILTQGNHALHYAVEGLDADLPEGDQFEIIKELSALGVFRLKNVHQLTPLLLASNNCKTELVEYLIKRPECTKEQEIEAFELLGASLATVAMDTEKAFKYMKCGMEGRFEDLSCPLLKQEKGCVEAYDNKKESRTLEELALIEGDNHAIIMEGLVIRERILGTNHEKLIDPIANVSRFYFQENQKADLCIKLRGYAMEIRKQCNQPIICDLEWFIGVLSKMVKENCPPLKVIVKLFEETVGEYQKTKLQLQKVKEEGEYGPHKEIYPSHYDKFEDLACNTEKLLYHSKDLLILTTYAKSELHGNSESSYLRDLLQSFLKLNPRDNQGNSLLHLVVSQKPKEVVGGRIQGSTIKEAVVNRACVEAMKIILNAGCDVNIVNTNGNTPLHTAATTKLQCGQDFKPVTEDVDLLTEMLQILLDGGACRDFVNNDGKTALDLAATDTARSILSQAI